MLFNRGNNVNDYGALGPSLKDGDEEALQGTVHTLQQLKAGNFGPMFLICFSFKHPSERFPLRLGQLRSQ